MSQLLTVSRAARLAGVSRGAIQKKIKNGELPTFEGMVKPSDLLLSYPEARLEDNTVLERVMHIKNTAFAKRVQERVLPDAEVLAARLHELAQELVRIKHQKDQYAVVLKRLQHKFNEIEVGDKTDARNLLATIQAWFLEEVGHLQDQTYIPQPLLIKDSLLKVMAAHVLVQGSGHDFFVEGRDNLLESALRAGVALNYGCSDGSCGQCMAKVVSGQIKQMREPHYSLSSSEIERGYALMCCHTAVTDLVIQTRIANSPNEIPIQRLQAKTKVIAKPNASVAVLNLQTPPSHRFRFLAGQHARVVLASGQEEQLAIASCPCEDRHLQFHVPRMSRQDFSDHIFRELKIGDEVTINGPYGSYILREDTGHELLFIAYETGFAPIKSLMEHAMAVDPSESIHLYWYAHDAENHYMSNLCRAWSDALDNVHYTPLTISQFANIKFVDTFNAVGEKDINDFDVYISGPREFVDEVRKQLFALGLPEEQLFANVQKL